MNNSQRKNGMATRRVPLTKEQRMFLPRNAYNLELKHVGTFWRTDSGYWGWKANDGRMGLANSGREAVELCAKQKIWHK